MKNAKNTIDFNETEKVILGKIAEQLEYTYYGCGLDCFKDVTEEAENIDDEELEKNILSIIEKLKKLSKIDN